MYFELSYRAVFMGITTTRPHIFKSFGGQNNVIVRSVFVFLVAACSVQDQRQFLLACIVLGAVKNSTGL